MSTATILPGEPCSVRSRVEAKSQPRPFPDCPTPRFTRLLTEYGSPYFFVGPSWGVFSEPY
jgi:hypothetical protein